MGEVLNIMEGPGTAQSELAKKARREYFGSGGPEVLT